MQFWKRLFPDKQKSKPADGHPYDINSLPTGARLHYQEGVELLHAGKLGLAEAEFIRANEIAPWHKLPLFMLVYAILHQDKVTQAEEIIQELLDDSPLDSFAIFLQAHLNFYQQNYEDALQLYDKALYRRFWIPQPHIERAWILINLKGDFEKAKKDIEKIKLLEPENPAIYELEAKIAFQEGNDDKVLSLLNKGLEIYPDSEVFLHMRGSHYTTVEQYDEAIKDLARVLEINPSNYLALTEITNAYLAIKDYEKAYEIHFPYYKEHSNDADVQYAMAVIYQGKNELEKAIECFDQSIELNSANYLVWTYRGTAFYTLEDFNKAIDDYTKAIQLYSEYEKEIKNNLASNVNYPNELTLLVSRRNAFVRSKQYEKALIDDTKIITMHKERGLYLRALTYSGLKQFENAIKDLDSLIEIAPNHASAYNDRSWYKSYDGDLATAILDAEKAISLNSENSNYYGTRGQAKWLMKDYEGALVDFKQATELTSKETHQLETAVALLKLNKYDEAISLWQEVTSDEAEFQSAEAYQEKYRFAPPFYEAMQELEKLAQNSD